VGAFSINGRRPSVPVSDSKSRIKGHSKLKMGKKEACDMGYP